MQHIIHWYIADLLQPILWVGIEVFTIDEHFAAIWPFARKSAHQCRLACAIRANNGRQCTRLDAKRDITQDQFAFATNMKVICL
ncbi:MAG: hypothetical protein U0350_49370 [Caldilineaceae bacterium]